MTEKTIELDQRRGMTAQEATDLRRLLADVEANEKLLPPSAGRIGSSPACSAVHELVRSRPEGAISTQSFRRLPGRADSRRHKLIGRGAR